MAALGIWVARKIARVDEAEAFLPIVPAAFVVFGGTFVHLFQTSVSIALGIMLLGIGRRVSPVLRLGLVLQIPLRYAAQWLTHPYTLARFESVAAIALFLLLAPGGRDRHVRIALAAAACVTYVVVSVAILHAPRGAIRAPERALYAQHLGADMRFATGEWGRFIRATPFANACNAMVLARKIPIWLGILYLLVATIAATRERRGLPYPAVPRAKIRGTLEPVT